ncbi:MAG: HAD family phosphatase [Candidatus Woesearchaeota archaeon]|nr:MAG: HAD family phosphatase [Candidatus Woesearchaeota archaeon]
MKYKLILFDLDGTLFDVGFFENKRKQAASTWTLIDRELGCTKEKDRLLERWINNEFDFETWAKLATEIYKRHNLTESQFNKVIESIKVMPGAKETLSKLKSYKTAVITGSFRKLALRAKTELGINYIFAAAEFIFDKTGKLISYTILPCDYDNKITFFNALIKSLNISPEECIFVGDGVNDIPIAKEVGLSIAFNAREELKEVCDVIIDKKDLREILNHLPS